MSDTRTIRFSQRAFVLGFEDAIKLRHLRGVVSGFASSTPFVGRALPPAPRRVHSFKSSKEFWEAISSGEGGEEATKSAAEKLKREIQSRIDEQRAAGKK